MQKKPITMIGPRGPIGEPNLNSIVLKKSGLFVVESNEKAVGSGKAERTESRKLAHLPEHGSVYVLAVAADSTGLFTREFVGICLHIIYSDMEVRVCGPIGTKLNIAGIAAWPRFVR